MTFMPIAKYTLETPGITTEKLAKLEKRRKKWLEDYEVIKQEKKQAIISNFLALYPDWDTIKFRISERSRAVLEAYYGLGTKKLTMAEIGEELATRCGKPLTKQVVHLSLKKAHQELKNPPFDESGNRLTRKQLRQQAQQKSFND